MTSEFSSADPMVTAARAALLAAYAGLAPEDATALPRAYALRSDPRAQRVEEFIDALVAQPKPFVHTATLADGVLTLEALADGPIAQFWSTSVVEQLPATLAFMRETYGEASDPPVILLRGVGESLLLSLRDYERWQRDYPSAGLYNSSMRAADVDARVLGATAVVRFGPPGGFRFGRVPLLP